MLSLRGVAAAADYTSRKDVEQVAPFMSPTQSGLLAGKQQRRNVQQSTPIAARLRVNLVSDDAVVRELM